VAADRPRSVRVAASWSDGRPRHRRRGSRGMDPQPATNSCLGGGRCPLVGGVRLPAVHIGQPPGAQDARRLRRARSTSGSPAWASCLPAGSPRPVYGSDPMGSWCGDRSGHSRCRSPMHRTSFRACRGARVTELHARCSSDGTGGPSACGHWVGGMSCFATGACSERSSRCATSSTSWSRHCGQDRRQRTVRRVSPRTAVAVGSAG